MSVSSDKTSTKDEPIDKKCEEIRQLALVIRAALEEGIRQEKEKLENKLKDSEAARRDRIRQERKKTKINTAPSLETILHQAFNSKELDDLSFEELEAFEETLRKGDTEFSSSEVTARSDRTFEPGDQRSEARRTSGGPKFYLELLRGSVSKHAGLSRVFSRESSEALFGAFTTVGSSGLSDKKMGSQIRKMSNSDKTSTKDMFIDKQCEEIRQLALTRKADVMEAFRQEQEKFRNYVAAGEECMRQKIEKMENKLKTFRGESLESICQELEKNATTSELVPLTVINLSGDTDFSSSKVETVRIRAMPPPHVFRKHKAEDEKSEAVGEPVIDQEVVENTSTKGMSSNENDEKMRLDMSAVHASLVRYWEERDEDAGSSGSASGATSEPSGKKMDN
ncbi:hypothetical protein B9Z55_011303 [Caenorhabditis nigoni]|uniref:Uncharacterized protein n=1 Tax=Caenorhabditis nigoni TaxID=1611254 RepID=A0A2G5UK28_9PELO|nr:hypothetical protein B9Z55_011303 [Caenorhabditis nigoni]